ncbi:indolepyruvate oxidoreductase subunit beta [Dethiobacter alkaliphilus]|uniref:Pyruvate ferredoxin/flavodoxin oxidoreductase n=1 Tax=Dethiobacter alkaliphilus AHT 1 TaxID=555088 RepID=C0GJD8_DETAL|nr:indolepyruvate oxidoreductase subunit beta [Dethiobacter alkaliphilus]EEG76485.1 pyruvate ferredoxin/flavodoxin oxidoreductase [Dethiobacter alkaliphilus AHT 1]MCW3488705.1 indolepyruvate oxidoreductase subunit beta [Dethiobacter alkaliphilus]
MPKTTSILMGGVGGQGIILASKILAHVIQAHGLDLKISEIHGMAQRGGSVLTHMRYGEEVHSPLIEAGQADYIVASEKLESWRWLPFLRPGGTLVMNTQEIKPVPVIIGAQKYPQTIMEKMEALSGQEKIYAMDALEAARACGQPKASNVVLVGVLARSLEFPLESFLEALEAVVPARFLETNKKAFMSGYEHFSS